MRGNFTSFSILGRIEGGEAAMKTVRVAKLDELSVSSAGSKGVKRPRGGVGKRVRWAFSILGRIEGGEAARFKVLATGRRWLSVSSAGSKGVKLGA